MKRPHRAVAAMAAVVVLTGLFGPVTAAPAGPRLRVVAATNHLEAMRYGDAWVYLDMGIYLAALDAPFEVRVARDSYRDPIEAWQVLSGAATRPIPTELLEGWWSLSDFAGVRILRDGDPIRSISLDWCPGSADPQRINDEGAREPTYPRLCWGSPFTLGHVFGIDQGWSSALAPSVPVRLGEGEYTARLRIRPAFRDLFGIAPEDASAEVSITVTSWDGGCFECKGDAARIDGSQGGRTRVTSAPTDTDPDPDSVPDLRALPAFGIHVETHERQDWLTFGANVWNAGPAPLVVEGFRQEGEDLMDAFQYFTQDGEIVGRAPVGGFEYDRHDDHQHWHFLQFARYRLLDDTKQAMVRSRKQAFCLAPTDAIDLLLPNADWNPGYLGFSHCGGPASLWIREVLQVGWGDTYFQGLFGQGFDVTDLPNGTYYIEVTANPQGLLYETGTKNNRRLRKVVLRGRPGFRRVIVPAWNGIDTERTKA